MPHFWTFTTTRENTRGLRVGKVWNFLSSTMEKKKQKTKNRYYFIQLSALSFPARCSSFYIFVSFFTFPDMLAFKSGPPNSLCTWPAPLYLLSLYGISAPLPFKTCLCLWLSAWCPDQNKVPLCLHGFSCRQGCALIINKWHMQLVSIPKFRKQLSGYFFLKFKSMLVSIAGIYWLRITITKTTKRLYTILCIGFPSDSQPALCWFPKSLYFAFIKSFMRRWNILDF